MAQHPHKARHKRFLVNSQQIKAVMLTAPIKAFTCNFSNIGFNQLIVSPSHQGYQ